MHIIIGKGNLGLDIQNTLNGAGISTFMVSGSEGFPYPSDAFTKVLNGLKETNTIECLWVTAGAGSVGAVDANPTNGIDTHVRMFLEILKIYPNTLVVGFSTDYIASQNILHNNYCQGEPQSLYALTKKWLEDLALFRKSPKFKVIRVSSLYGHNNDKSFPYRMLELHKSGKELKFVENAVTPTPTKWLAEKLVENMKFLESYSYPIMHLAPFGSIAAREWATLITGAKYESSGVDETRPLNTLLDSTFPFKDKENILVLWDKYWTKWENKYVKPE